MLGKPYSEALTGDLPEAISTIRYYAGFADKSFGQTINTTPQKFAYTIRQPIGVVGQIIPVSQAFGSRLLRSSLVKVVLKLT